MERSLIFSVPIWNRQINFDEDTLKDIKNFCINLSEKIPGRILTNRGGYQSKDIISSLYQKYPLDILYNNIEYVMRFLEKDLILNKKLEIGNIWININKKGDFNLSHNHPKSMFAGICYISCSDDRHGVVFENPHPAEQFYLNGIAAPNTPLTSNKYKVPSIPGMMYVFPPWLLHYVPEYTGEGERITIAFNIQ
jgi:uncharacterized protein (TIGR02466 family)